MCRRQPLAALVEDQAGQQAGLLCVCAGSPLDAVLGEHRLDLVPQGLVDDGRMLSGIGIALVRDLAAIDPVLKHEIKGPAGELVTAIDSAVGEGAALAPDPRSIEFRLQGHAPT